MSEKSKPKSQKISQQLESNQKIPPVYIAGLIGLAAMAFVEFRLASEIVDMSGTAWGFSGLLSFSVAILGGPIWFGIGIACIAMNRKVPAQWRSSLIAIGVLNIIGIGMVAFCPMLYRQMFLAWWIYWGIIAGCLIFRLISWKKSQNRSSTKGVSVAKDENCWKIGFVILWIVIIVMGIFVTRNYTSGTLAVRRKWGETTLAQSTVFPATEDKSRATDDTIYLQIDGIDGEVEYQCKDNSSCWYNYGMVNGAEPGRVGSYFWLKNWDKINQILAKYPELDQWAPMQIHVFDRDAIEPFVRDIMEIEDMQKLYQAYLEAEEKTDRTAARVEFGEFFLDVRDGGKDERIVLFEYYQDL